MRVALALSLLLATTLHAQPADLDTTVTRTLQTFDVPGIAVAIVKDGQVVLTKGWGVRKLGDPAPVTAQTRFGIASNTKAFTAAALAMLVDEGKLRWDDKVIEHIPSFQMYDPYVTREMTVRDLLVHRSGLGLGAGDLLFWPPSTYTSDEIIPKLRYIKPATSFRSRYAYDNILYIVAGKVIENVSGKPWGTFIRERIFTPLGMTNSNTSTTLHKADDHVAMPHAKADGKLTPLPLLGIDNHAPAGAINANAVDLTKWMIALLDRGAIRGTDKRLYSEKQAQELWSPVTIMPISEPKKPIAATKPNFLTYALGFNVRDYRGRVIVTHTGGLPGMVTRVLLVPEMNLGFAVLTNQEARGGYESVAYTILDHYLNAPKTDWVAAFKAAQDEIEADAEKKVKESATARAANTKPSLAPAKYAGTYRDPWYGDVSVAHENGKLVMRFSRTPGLVGDLEHWQYDTFVARWRDRSLGADAFVTFHLSPDGAVESAKMKPVSPLTDFSYDFQDLALHRQE